jgi:hypothetical protein
MLLLEPMVTVPYHHCLTHPLTASPPHGHELSQPLQSISWRRQLMLLSEPIVTVLRILAFLSFLLPLLLMALYRVTFAVHILEKAADVVE